jgi:ectoine hydroxylase-related dioxygenase (phytanoyl-CoA dioxygenase family)
MQVDWSPATVFSSALARPLTVEEMSDYRQGGATVVRGILSIEWIARMGRAVDRILASPGSAGVEYTPKEKSGRYYGDFFVWLRDPDFKALMMDSPLPELAAQLMGSKRVSFFYDQLLVKEPGTAEPTPLHQDIPYWPLKGEHIVSIWVPFDPVRFDSGVVQYIYGSHTWGKLYAPKTFGEDTGFASMYARSGFLQMPPEESVRNGQHILKWETEPGDVVIHHPRTLHFSHGNARSDLRRRAVALRYLGDDAYFDARPGTFMDNPKVRALLPSGSYEFKDGDRMINEAFPLVWPRG